MSISLGSAVGSIELRSDGVTKGVQSAVAALRSFEAQTAGAGKNLDKLSQAGAQSGSAVAKGVQQASQSLKQLGDAGQQAGNAVAKGTDQAAASVQRLAQSTQGIGAAFDQIGNAAGVLGGTLAAGIGVAVKSAGDLQTAVTRISTIAPEIDVSGVSRQLSQLSTEVGASATSLAEAMNNIFSSIETNQAGALKLTEEFAKGAIGAGTNAETFGSAVLGVMNSFSISTEGASHIADVFFNVLDKGVINGQELATGLGQVTQSAKGAGVSFDQLGALIAASTREGGQASTALTNLQNVLAKLTTAETQKGLADLGIQTKDASGNFRNIVTVLDELKRKLDTLNTGDRSKVLQDLFPDIQARAGISVLLNQLDTVKQVVDSNANAAGVAAAAYEKMGNTAEAAGNRLKASLVAVLTEAGNIALPGLEATAGQLQRALVAFSQLSPEVKNAAVYGAEAAAGVLLFGSAATKAVTGVRALAGAVQTLQAASVGLGGLATIGPALAGVAIIAGVVAIGLKGTNDALSGTAKIIDGDLGAAIAKLKFSWQDMFFQGDVNKLQQAVKDYAQGIDGTVPSVEELRATLAKVNTEVDKLGSQTFRGFGDDQRLTQLRNVKIALEDQIKAEEKRRALYGTNGPTSDTESDRQYEIQIRKNTEALNENVEAEKRAQAARNFNTPAPVNPITPYGLPESDAPTIDARAANILNEQAAAALSAQLAFDAYRQSLSDFAATNASAMQAITAQTGPMIAALDLVNQKKAQGIPLSARENQLLSDVPGSLAGATAAYNDLIISQGALAVQQQRASAAAGEQNTAFSGMGGSAGALAGQLQTLQGALFGLNSAFGALGTENAKLSAQFNVLGERITILQEKAKTKIGLSGDEQVELDTLLTTQTKIGDQIGINAAKQRDNVVAQQQTTEAAQATATALEAINKADLAAKSDPFTFREDRRTAVGPDLPPPAPVKVPIELDEASKGIAIAGINAIGTEVTPVKVPVQLDTTALTGGAGVTASLFANAVQAQTVTVDVQDNASVKLQAINSQIVDLATSTATPIVTVQDDGTAIIDGITGALTTLGELSATPTANLEDNASGPIGDVTGAVNALDGRVIHITASVDTSAALAAISDLRAHMPSSPAKKGPFHVLPEWGSVFNSLAPAADDAVLTIQATTQAMSRALGGGIAELTDEAAKAAAELATTVAGAVSATTTALNGLRTFRPPDPSRFVALHDALIPILAAFTGDAAGSTEDGLKATSAYAENAQKIVGLVAQGADALTKLESFVRPTDAAIRAFRDASQFLVNVMVQVAADSAGDLVEAGGVYAESAGKIYAAVGQGVDALVKLQDFKRPSDKAVTDFRDVAQYVVNVLAQVARDAELDAVADAGSWGDSAGKVFAALGGGVAALVKLQDFQRPTDKAVTDFRDVSQFLVNVIAQVAADIDKDALANAGVYADTAGKIVSLLGTGVDAFAKLASGELTLPDVGRLQAFAEATRQATVAISAAAAQIDGDAVDAAAVYADGAGKVVSLIGQGVQGFAGLSTFVAPSVGQINNFKSAVSATVIAIAQASRELDKDAVKAAGEYADGAGKAVGLLGGAVSAFKSIGDKDFVVPSKEAIDAVVSVTRYGVDQLIGISGSYSGGQLAQLSAFASAAGAGYNALGAALDASKALGTEGRIKPADAIGQAAAEFRDGLAPLSELVGISQTYATQGAQIGANIAQAYNAIAGGLPGYNTNQATVAANVTVSTPTQVIVHRAEGAVDIRFLGENGGWVVSSLQADKTARDGVIGIVAEGIAPIFAGMRG